MKKWLIVAAILVLVAAALYLRSRNLPEAVESPPEGKPSSFDPRLSRPATDKIALPTPTADSPIPPADTELQYAVKRFSDCDTYFKGIQGLRSSIPPPNNAVSPFETQEAFEARYHYRGYPWIADPASCSDVPPALSDAHGEYLKQCASFVSPKSGSTNFASWEDRSHCDEAYRRYLAHALTLTVGNRRLTEIKDPVLLSATIEASLSPVIGGYLDTSRATLAAEQLFRIKSDNPETAKTLLAMISYYGQTPDGPAKQPNWSLANAALKKLRELRPNEPFLEEYSIFVESRGFKADRIKTILDRYAAAGSKSGAVYFFLAQWEASHNRQSTAREYREKALAIAPTRLSYEIEYSFLTMGGALPGIDYEAQER